MAKSYLDEVKEEILMHLADRPYTIAVLCDLMQKPYTTVQQAHLALRNENKIVRFDRKHRNAKYTIAPTGAEGSAVSSTVPYLRFANQDIKPTELFVGTVNMPQRVYDQTRELIKIWVSMARMAQRLNDGTADYNAAGYLKRRTAMLVDIRNTFENMSFLCNQLLDNPKFWDASNLASFSADETWEDYLPTLEKMYLELFGDDE